MFPSHIFLFKYQIREFISFAVENLYINVSSKDNYKKT